MSYSPSVRGETECTSASKASTVGSSSSGVSAGVPTTSTNVAPGGVSRPCLSPLHPSRTTVQRVTNTNTSGSSPPSPVPRGCNAPSCSVVAASTAEATPAAAASPPTLASPTTAPPSPVAAATTTATAPHRPHATTASSDVVLPSLTPAHPVHASAADMRAAPAPAPPPTVFPAVVYPTLTRTHATSSAVEAGEDDAERGRTEQGKGAKAASHEVKAEPQLSSSPIRLAPTLPVGTAADTACSPPSPSDSAQSPSRSTSEPYFRDNNVPRLFNELSEALLEARPENPVAFMAEWLRQRRDALA